MQQQVPGEAQTLFQGLILQSQVLNALLGVCRPLMDRDTRAIPEPGTRSQL